MAATTPWHLILTSAAVLGALGAAAALVLRILNRSWPADDSDLVEQINAALPQTQCAQCGFPGCRPYAQAVAAGDAGIDLCPPGGQQVLQDLARLTGSRDVASTMPEPVAQVAVIDEARCIGCARCLAPCPVDAIVGAPQKMHTVLSEHCTGCELCLPPCPVDCIDLVTVSQPPAWPMPQ